MTLSVTKIAAAVMIANLPIVSLTAEPKPPLDPIQSGEDAILGKPPRIKPVKEFSEEMRVLATPPQPFQQVVPDMFATIMHNPELLRRFIPMMKFILVDSSLPPRDRELAILRNAWLMQAPYEWGEHVHIAKERGVSAEEILWIVEGSDAPGWSDHDRAILKATEELHHDVMISDATWSTLTKTYNEAQLVEFPMLIGQYRAVASLQNSLRMALRPGIGGLSSR